jgi:hypothetical protein
MTDDVFLRRVRHPEPLLEALASDVVDLLERLPSAMRTPKAIGEVATLYQLPYAYILDELERRVRARRTARTPEKGPLNAES